MLCAERLVRNSRSVRRAMAAAPLVGLLASCTVGPDYKPPAAAVPARFAGTTEPAQTDVALARWWTGFGDPTLDDLVARAAAWPSLSANAQVTRTHLSRNAISLSGLGVLAGGAPSSANLSSTG